MVMSHIDCNTIPFFWQYASRFVIFDNIFATEDTPSTPNAIAMLAGQSGETQWVKHPSIDGTPTDTGITAPYSGTVFSYASNGSVTSTTYSGTGTDLQGRRSSAIRSPGGARSSTTPATTSGSLMRRRSFGARPTSRPT